MSDSTPIRSFIYMDSDRLVSLYSQVFEGVAEAIVQSYYSTKEMQEENINRIQAKTMQEKLGEYSTKTENKVLNDHMYNQLAKKLEKKIFDCSEIDDRNYYSELQDKFIVQVAGKSEIQDYSKLTMFFDKYNEMGEVIAYSSIQNGDAQGLGKNIKETAKKLGLYQEPKLLSNLKFMTEMFLKDELHIIIQNVNGIKFKCILNKKFLRLDPSSLKNLYTAFPTSKITVVGEITYLPNNFKEERVNGDLTLQKAYANMFRSMADVEKTFLESDEVIIHISPIAIYTEQYI